MEELVEVRDARYEIIANANILPLKEKNMQKVIK